ncbi:MAG: hypothetical protein K2X69_13400 [Silvanigrellaceae bacterium]|nr:hypothetical protein [Silvanigrellaceae bacterium]
MANQITYEIISLSTLGTSSTFESAQDILKNSKPFILIKKEGDSEVEIKRFFTEFECQFEKERLEKKL